MKDGADARTQLELALLKARRAGLRPDGEGAAGRSSGSRPARRRRRAPRPARSGARPRRRPRRAAPRRRPRRPAEPPAPRRARPPAGRTGPVRTAHRRRSSRRPAARCDRRVEGSRPWRLAALRRAGDGRRRHRARRARPPPRSPPSSPRRTTRRPRSPPSRSSSPTRRRPSRASPPASSSRWTRFAELWPAVLESLAGRGADARRACSRARARRGSTDGELTLAWPRVRRVLQAQGRGPGEQGADRRARSAPVTGSSLRLAYELRADERARRRARAAPPAVRGGARQPLRGGVRRRGAAPRGGVHLMPQPPNLNKMLEQAQAMLAQQQEAQEKLKDERSRPPPAAAWSRS